MEKIQKKEARTNKKQKCSKNERQTAIKKKLTKMANPSNKKDYCKKKSLEKELYCMGCTK